MSALEYRTPQHFRAGLLASLFFIYSLSFGLALIEMGYVVTALASLPVMLVAWFYGRKAGLFAGAAITLLSFGLIQIILPEEGLLLHAVNGGISLLVLGLLSFLMHWIKEMLDRLANELADRQQIEVALRESEQRYRLLFNFAGDAIFIHDLEGRFLDANEIACQQLGYSRDELLKMNVTEVDTLENAAKMPERAAELEEKGQILFESAHVRQDRKVIPVEMNSRLISYKKRAVVLSIARDITKRKLIENAEREQRALAEALRDIAADLTGTLQLEEVLDRILKNVQQVVRHDAATIMLLQDGLVRVMRHQGYQERGLGELVEDLQVRLENFPPLVKMVKTQQPVIIQDIQESDYWHATQATYWIRSYIGVPIIFKSATIGFLNVESAYPGFYRDEHAERLQAFAHYAAVAIQNARLYAEVQQIALVDELTGLYNRRGLIELGQREVERALRFKRPLAAMLIDIDNFKAFNDEYSYVVGDEVLATLARRIKENMRRVDLVCRYGGDEFVALLAENNLETALIAAEHVRQSIVSTPFETGQGAVEVTVSIGLAVLDQQDWDLTQLIEAAGQANHEAKLDGRNQVAENKHTSSFPSSFPNENPSTRRN